MRKQNKVLQIRLADQQKKEIAREAYAEGKSVTEYLLDGHRIKMLEKGMCPCCGQVIKKK